MRLSQNISFGKAALNSAVLQGSNNSDFRADIPPGRVRFGEEMAAAAVLRADYAAYPGTGRQEGEQAEKSPGSPFPAAGSDTKGGLLL
jgi:hypothetical protein